MLHNKNQLKIFIVVCVR